MDFSYFGSVLLILMQGLKYTISLFFITIVLSLPLGLCLTFLRISKNRIVSGIIGGFVYIMRGTPLLLQLFFVYYGLIFIPLIGNYLSMDRFTAACVAFVLNYSAYFCEIFRGGLLSVDKGQHEAAKVLGFSKLTTTVRIIIPQMLRVSLPPVSNECITLMKDTALVTAIGITEILYYSKTRVNADSNPFAYVVAAFIYLVITFGLTKLFQFLEKKFSY